MRPTYAKRVDANHWELFIAAEKYLKKNKINASVINTSMFGSGFPDFIVVSNEEIPTTVYFEVKNQDEYWKLTDDEMVFFRQAWASYAIVETAKDVVNVLTDMINLHHVFKPNGGITFRHIAVGEVITYKHLKQARELYSQK